MEPYTITRNHKLTRKSQIAQKPQTHSFIKTLTTAKKNIELQRRVTETEDILLLALPAVTCTENTAHTRVHTENKPEKQAM